MPVSQALIDAPDAHLWAAQCVLLIIGLTVHRWAALHPRASLKYETFPLTMKRWEPSWKSRRKAASAKVWQSYIVSAWATTGRIKSLRGDAAASLQDEKVTVEFFGFCIFGFLSGTTVRKKVKLQM